MGFDFDAILDHIHRTADWFVAFSAAEWAAIAASAVAAISAISVCVSRLHSRKRQRKLRAYLEVAEARVNLANSEVAPSLQAEVELTNVGETPGDDFETWAGVAVSSLDDDPFKELGDPRQASALPRSATTSAHSIPLGL